MAVRLEKTVKRFLADREGEVLPGVGDSVFNESGNTYTLTANDLPVGSTVKYRDTNRISVFNGQGWTLLTDVADPNTDLLAQILGELKANGETLSLMLDKF